MDLRPHIQKFKNRLTETEALLSDPNLFNNQRRAQEVTRDHSRFKKLVDKGEAWLHASEELEENKSLLESETEGSELALMAQDEIERLEPLVAKLYLDLQWGVLPPDPTDSRNTIVEIRAGAGGAESALFAAALYRMYCRYAETRGWKVEEMSTSPSELGGLREIVVNITGEDTYKRLKFESGVHRVQRVPATEASGRIHTSTVTVAVLPEAEEVDVELKPEDLDVSICRAGGPGGQGVNTTDSAVQIIHRPTGMTVRCMDQRSQIKNRERAMKVLRSRLLERKIAEEAAKYAAERKSQVGTGERSERIRTYNFPQNRVSDHRIELTLFNLPDLMEGDLDCLIDPLLTNDLNEKLAEVAAS